MKRYFVWKDGKHNGKETEWIEVDESEYERIRSEEPARRFNQSFDDNNSAEDHFYYEVPEDEYKYWNRERMNYERHNKKVFGKNTVVSFDDLVDPNDEEYNAKTGGGFTNMEAEMKFSPIANAPSDLIWMMLPQSWYVRYSTDKSRAYEIDLANLPAQFVLFDE